MAKVTEVRLTLAALIYGIEIDLKSLINQAISPFHQDLSFLKDKALEQKVIGRFNNDNPGLDYTKSIGDVIEYIDFGDTFSILNKNEVFLKKEVSAYVKAIFNVLIEIIPIRNRVMHTRPLLGGDFATILDFTSKLKVTDPINWKVTIETKLAIEKDPSYVLALNLPKSLSNENISPVVHNLPMPDFDETGFIGRTKDVEDIKQLIISNRVITVLGDGGVGKTALALKVAYDIVDLNDKSPFELIIWTTAKTTMLTSKGIEEIYSAITDYTGLIDVIADNLDKNVSTNKLDTILEYLDLFKTLIIIDNLETIHNEEVRNFIRKAQEKAHILITSRIGLGELELPRKLSGLSESESSKLIREIAKIRNSETLMKLPQKNLAEISEKLYYNPLALKWFVNAVEMGITPAEVLNNKHDLLNFCLTNVYDKLGEGAINVLNTIRASRRKLTTGEIIYLSDYEPLEVRKFLIELFKTTLVNREIKDASNIEEVYYYISDFAKDFLSKNHQINQEYIKNVSRKFKELESGLKKISSHKSYNEFSINAVSFKTTNQRIAAKFLSEALSFSRTGIYDKALQKVNEAKDIDPNYAEVYRVSAFIKATQGDILDAEEDYKIGLEIEPNNIRLLFYYAQFLLFSLEDVDTALEFAEKVYREKPDHPFTALLFARCYNANREFVKAIKILTDLVTDNELDPKNKRVTFTELINVQSSLAYELFTIENDIKKSIQIFKESFNTFDECINSNSLDVKVINSYVNSLHTFISILPVIEIKTNLATVQEQIEKHEKQISLIHNPDKLILKYADKFKDDGFNYLLKEEVGNSNNIGNIKQIYNDRSYSFVESEAVSYFAHMNDFIDINNWDDWQKLESGQLITFEIGTNVNGPCAKNIKLCT